MLRRPYVLNTLTTDPVSSRDTKLVLLDPTGLVLEEGDWAYLELEEYGKLEIVKAISLADNIVSIVRGQDNTLPQDFAEPSVKYTLTAQEIIDSIPVPTVTLYGAGAVQVEDTQVTVERLLIGYVGVHYSFGIDGKIIIGREENAYGCCGADNGVGGLAHGIFYLTSLPYPIEITEKLSSSYSLLAIGFAGRRFDRLESIDISGGLANIAMKDIIHTTYPIEKLDLTSSIVVEMKDILHESFSLEKLDLTSSVTVEMRPIVVENFPLEKIDLFSAITGILMYDT